MFRLEDVPDRCRCAPTGFLYEVQTRIGVGRVLVPDETAFDLDDESRRRWIVSALNTRATKWSENVVLGRMMSPAGFPLQD